MWSTDRRARGTADRGRAARSPGPPAVRVPRAEPRAARQARRAARRPVARGRAAAERGLAAGPAAVASAQGAGDGRLQGREQLSLELPADAWVDWEAAFGHLADVPRGGGRFGLGGGLAVRPGGRCDRRRRPAARAGGGLDRRAAAPSSATCGSRRWRPWPRSGARLGGGELSAAEEAARAAVEAAPFRETARVALMDALRARRQRRRGAARLRGASACCCATSWAPRPARRCSPCTSSCWAPASPPAAAPAPPRSPRRRRRAGASCPTAWPRPRPPRWVGRRTPARAPAAASSRPRATADTGLVLLTGEGGIGKTRLLAELAAGAERLRRALRALRRGGAVPLRALDRDARRPPRAASDDAELPGLLGARGGPDLARLLPELRVAGARPGRAARATDPETERRRLFAAVDRRWSRRLAERSPLLLIIDDLHWADRSSLLLGRQLGARRAARPRAAARHLPRHRAVRRATRCSEVLADLERERAVPRRRWPGLDPEEVAELVGAHADGLERRHRARDRRGDPRQPVLRQAAAAPPRGGRRRDPRRRRLRLAGGLRDVIARRVARLPEDAGRVLRVAALIGRDFELDVLERVVRPPRGRAARPARRRRARRDPGRGREHPGPLLVRARAAAHAARGGADRHPPRAPAPPHRRGDRGAATGTGSKRHLDDLARHFAAAGPEEVDRAVTYAERAAEQADGRLAYEEAADLLAGAAGRPRARRARGRGRARPPAAAAGRRPAGGPAGGRPRATPTPRPRQRPARPGRRRCSRQAALGHAGGALGALRHRGPGQRRRCCDEALDLLPDGRLARCARSVLARLSGVLYYSPGSEETAAPSWPHEAIAMARRLDDDRGAGHRAGRGPVRATGARAGGGARWSSPTSWSSVDDAARRPGGPGRAPRLARDRAARAVPAATRPTPPGPPRRAGRAPAAARAADPRRRAPLDAGAARRALGRGRAGGPGGARAPASASTAVRRAAVLRRRDDRAAQRAAAAGRDRASTSSAGARDRRAARAGARRWPGPTCRPGGSTWPARSSTTCARDDFAVLPHDANFDAGAGDRQPHRRRARRRRAGRRGRAAAAAAGRLLGRARPGARHARAGGLLPGPAEPAPRSSWTPPSATSSWRWTRAARCAPGRTRRIRCSAPLR